MKRDQKLVALFFDKYNEHTDSTFQVKEWVDASERTKPAVEAIAVDREGLSLAIEHTLLQPFVGERDDTVRFLTAIGSLEKEESLRLRDYSVVVNFYVGSIPKGVDWSAINQALREWLRDNLAALPVGRSTPIIPNLPFALHVGVEKTALPRSDGRIFFGRFEPPASLTDVMRASLAKKLPKLAGTDANMRILLLEQNDIAHGNNTIHEAIKAVGEDFPELARIDEIWVVNTVGWESEGFLFYFRVYPDLVNENELK